MGISHYEISRLVSSPLTGLSPDECQFVTALADIFEEQIVTEKLHAGLMHSQFGAKSALELACAVVRHFGAELPELIERMQS